MGKKDRDEKKLPFGPFEQALLALVVMGFASHPSFPYSPFTPSINPDGSPSLTPLPFLSPPFLMIVLIVYLGYYILRRQEGERDRLSALAAKSKPQPSSSSSSSSSNDKDKQPLSSSDVRDGKMTAPTNKKVGDPTPKQVSGSSSSKDDPSSTSFRKNYFLTMQGPGRPALVPFQDGLRPKKGEAAGTMWWDNVPDDAKDIMAPPISTDQLKATLKNPWQLEMFEKDIQLLKIAKRQKAEEERYAKVANILQTMLGFLLCAADMRLGIMLIVFFLWKHFTDLHSAQLEGKEDAIEEEKKEIAKNIKEAKKNGMSSQEVSGLQIALQRLG